MPSAQNLALAASKPPKMKYGDMCHHAVLEWLVEAKFLSDRNANRLLSGQAGGNVTALFGRIFARENDTEVTAANADVVLSEGGCVVGFWSGTIYQHTMVTIGNSRIIGFNNTNVNGPLRFGGMHVSQLRWDPNGNRVLPGVYAVRAAGAQDVKIRLDQEIATL